MDLNLKYACNLLNTLLRHNYEELYIGLNSQAIQKELQCRVQSKAIYSDFNKLRNSMERFVESHRKESIKHTVLKHEEIFKQQVQELHRLYEIQKKLMSDLRSKELKMNNSFLASSNPHVIADSKNRFSNSKSTSETSHCYQASALNHSIDLPNSKHNSIHRFFTAKSSCELSNCLGEPQNISREHALQQPVEVERHESCSNLDLTLSIGCANDMNKQTDWKRMTSDSTLLLSSNLIKPDGIEEYTNSAGGFGSESLKRPHWLFQALSFNRT